MGVKTKTKKLIENFERYNFNSRDKNCSLSITIFIFIT